MRMLADLPRQRPAVSLRHPVLRLDELIRRDARFERLEQFRVLKILDLGRLLKFGRVHGVRCSSCAAKVQTTAIDQSPTGPESKPIVSHFHTHKIRWRLA